MNAGEGTPLEELARDVLRRWQLDGEPERVDIGVNKATWKIGDSFWLSSDFTTAQEDTARLEGLLTRVAAEFGDGIGVPRFVPSPSGPVVEAGGRVWWVTRHVDGRHPDPASEPDMMAVAQGLAVMHEALSHVPREYAISGDTCEGLFRAGEALVGDDRLQFTPDDLDAARHSAGLVLKNLDTVLARGMQLTHGDPSNPNLFLSGSPARLTGAIDWDYARFDLVLSDVATMGQTILFRSGSSRPREFLQDALAAYAAAGGAEIGIEEALIGVLMVLFEAVAHHGLRFILGQGDYDRVGGRIDNMRTVLGILRA